MLRNKIRENSATDFIKNISSTRRAGITLVAAILLCSIYLVFAWNRYNKISGEEAIILANSLESMIHSEHVASLKGDGTDIDNPDYVTTKKSLMKLAETENKVNFAYLMAEKYGEMVFLVDSEKSDSPDYSPPGEVYKEADSQVWYPLTIGKTVLTRPTPDRWGNWISVLVPVRDPDNNEVIALFGIDYDAAEWYADIWKRMVPDIFVTTSVILLVVALLRSRDHYRLERMLKEKLGVSEALYHAIFDQAPLGIAISDNSEYVINSASGVMEINPMYQKILGRSSEELSRIKWTDITHPEDLAKDVELFEQMKTGLIDDYTMDKRFIRPDGTVVWVRMFISRLVVEDKNGSSHLCLMEDITDQKTTSDALKESERSKTLFLSKIPGMAYRCKNDRSWTIEYVSEGARVLTGYGPESLLYNKEISFNEVISEEYRDRVFEEWTRKLSRRESFQMEYEITCKNGEKKWVLELGEGFYESEGNVEALEGIILDITERKIFEDNIIYINEHDSWTGLHNRRYLEFVLRQAAEKKNGIKYAIVGFNLSTIQQLSSIYGFAYSQDVSKRAAEVLENFVSDKISIYCTHTDRYVLLVKDYRDKEELKKLVLAGIKELEPVLTPERIGGSIAIFELDEEHMRDSDKFFKKLLIVSEKAAIGYEGELNYRFFDQEMELEVEREETIRKEIMEISENLDDERLYLQYQPIYDLESKSICGFEALARLRSKKLGLVPPLEFIPIAEKCKFIVPMGRQIIVKALLFLRKLEAMGINKSIAINVSTTQILREGFLEELRKIIEEIGVKSHNVGIEITESIFTANYQQVNHILTELRDMGVKVSIDDFGTEYSSLARERELNVSCLKIDKSFVDELLVMDPDKTIVSDIISMAHKKNQQVIAEGVEHEEQFEYLKKHGCDKIQGYFISKPVDEDKSIELLG